MSDKIDILVKADTHTGIYVVLAMEFGLPVSTLNTNEGLVSKKYQIQKIQNLCNRWCYMSWPSSTFCS
jgi:phosphate/sulfate permease